MPPRVLDAEGQEAVLGTTRGYWLCASDFVSTEDAGFDVRDLQALGFPRDWPAVYSQSPVLKSLVGKKGRVAAKRVAVAGAPKPEEKAKVSGLSFKPLHSFENAERACGAGLAVVKGWAVFERLDRPPGAVFVAERYWWNAMPDGAWVDLTPRPEAFASLLLAEAVAGAPKSRSALSAEEAEVCGRLLEFRFKALAAAAVPKTPSSAAFQPPVRQAAVMPSPKPSAAKAIPDAKPVARKGAAPLDYSKWNAIVDSDEEDAGVKVSTSKARQGVAATTPEGQRPPVADYGVQDLMEGKQQRRPLPLPDYLVGNTGGGGGTNCYISVCKLLDAETKKEGTSENTHQLAQAFGKIFHLGIHDAARQQFYRQALAAVPAGAFVVVLGIGSVLPLLTVARRGANKGVLLEMSSQLATVAEEVLKANKLSLPVVAVNEGLDKAGPVSRAIKQHVPADAKQVIVLTEMMANDLLSSGIVPACVAVHQAIKARVPGAKVRHIPKTVELMATPLELRSEKLGAFDIRPFNAFRHTTSNDKADFWWWGVRLDNQQNTKVELLGPSQTLCGFDFDRSPEIVLEEVRRTIKMPIARRGTCNGVALWWTARFEDFEYSTKPRMAEQDAAAKTKPLYRSEWKQAVHYLAGETSVFVGESLDVLASITPRFTVRMMQESPFSVQAPNWIQAPTHAKFSATMPILPYHFLMLTDIERLEVFTRAIRAAVKQQRDRLGRRPRILDIGSGLGLLGMTAALDGADVWLCEAVPTMRTMCRQVVAANAEAVAEARGLVRLLPPMLSTRLQVGEDVDEKFDIIVAEVMDLWGLGEGVVPTMRHASKKLLAEGGCLLPSKLSIMVQPMELFMWQKAEKEHKANLSALGNFKSKFTPARIDQMPHRWLSEEPVAALEIDLANVPKQPQDGEPNLDGVKLCIRMGGKPALKAKITPMTVDRSGMLCGYGIWWACDLGHGNVITSDPSSPQRSWKQLVRWLDTPRFVGEGEELQVLACHNENQVNVEDIYIAPQMMEQCQEQLQADALRKAGHGQASAKAAPPNAKPVSSKPAKSAPPASAEADADLVEVD